MSSPRMLVICAAICAAVAWLAGPAGRCVVALPLLLFGPGYLCDRIVLRLPHVGAFVRPALWLGLSLSLVPLLYLWVTTIGAALSPTTLLMLAGLIGVAVFVVAWRHEAAGGGRGGSQTRPCAAGVALLALLLVVGWLRFEQIRDLVLPAWVDSVHHALLIRVALEHGQAPLSLRPYLPVDQLPYHWGYHVLVAALLAVTDLDLPSGMLWSGQVFNMLHVLVGAALAAYLWRKPWAGVVAGVVIGTTSLLPAYYVSWGRYTQLVGLLLLPPLLVAWREGLRTASWRWFAAATLLLAGLSLVHFRVLVFALCLLAVATGMCLLTQAGVPHARVFTQMLAAAAGSMLLTAPWLWLLVTRTLDQAAQDSRYIVNEAGSAVAPGLLWIGLNHWLIPLALLAAVLLLLRRSRAAAEQIGWVAGMFLLANPWLVRLPSLWLLSNEAVVISLFLPISTLIGGGACVLLEWAAGAARTTWRWRTVHMTALALLIALAGWGAWRQISVVNAATVLGSAADLRAIAWVEANTALDARFLINATGWQAGSERGVDGGWWLLPLAGRWTSTPPTVALYGSPDYVRAVQARNAFLAGFKAGQERQLFNLIGCDKINYVYFGTHEGMLTPSLFANRPGYRKVYAADGVTILAVAPETCYDPMGLR